MIVRALAAAAVLLALQAVDAVARPVTAIWDPTYDGVTVGYRIYYGPSPGAYGMSVDVGNVGHHQLDLIPGQPYYFAVRAYNVYGIEGPASNEAAIALPNIAPFLFSPGDLVIPAGPVSGQFVAGDPDGDRLTFFMSGLPGTVQLNSNTGAVSGTLSPGMYTVTIAASDGHMQARHTFSVRVIGPPCSAAPRAPSLLAPTASRNVVSLTWQPSAGEPAASYTLVAGSVPGAANVAVFDTGSPLTSVTTAAPNGVYYVRVAAQNACGVSAPSNEVTVSVGDPPPGVPAGLWADVNGSAVTLGWRTAPVGGPPTGYLIEAGSASGLADLATIPVGATTTTVSGVLPGHYYVRVRSVNGSGTSAPSPEIVVTVR